MLGDKQILFTAIPAALSTVLPAGPLPSFPRKRESRGGLPRLRHYTAVPFGIPAYAGMTVAEPGITVALPIPPPGALTAAFYPFRLALINPRRPALRKGNAGRRVSLNRKTA